jgi:uncharacterized tellurite resistance protein B-like protein
MLIFLGIIAVIVALSLLNSGNSTSGAPSSSSSSSDQEAVAAIAGSMAVGLYCAHSDGNVDNREIATLRRWKSEFLAKADDAYRSRLDSAMESEINRSLSGVSESRLHEACLAQRALPDLFKGLTMGLCFEVVAADRKVEPAEMAGLQKIARLLAISDTTFRALEEKHLRPIQIAAATSGTANASEHEKLLGIDPNWTKDQKLAQLTKEFAKYNARMQAVQDPAQRAQCRRMLELIAEFREELLTGRKPTPATPPPPPRPTGSSQPRPTIPPPVGSKDEILVGVDPSLSPRQKLAVLDAEEARWKGRQSLQLPAATIAKCEVALQAIRRLRNVYQSQL